MDELSEELLLEIMGRVGDTASLAAVSKKFYRLHDWRVIQLEVREGGTHYRIERALLSRHMHGLEKLVVDVADMFEGISKYSWYRLKESQSTLQAIVLSLNHEYIDIWPILNGFPRLESIMFQKTRFKTHLICSFPCLKSVTMRSTNFTVTDLHALLGAAPQLETLAVFGGGKYKGGIKGGRRPVVIQSSSLRKLQIDAYNVTLKLGICDRLVWLGVSFVRLLEIRYPLPSLQTLELHAVKNIENSQLSGWLSSCPCLNELKVENCWGLESSITVGSSSIRNLTLAVHDEQNVWIQCIFLNRLVCNICCWELEGLDMHNSSLCTLELTQGDRSEVLTTTFVSESLLRLKVRNVTTITLPLSCVKDVSVVDELLRQAFFVYPLLERIVFKGLKDPRNIMQDIEHQLGFYCERCILGFEFLRETIMASQL